MTWFSAFVPAATIAAPNSVCSRRTQLDIGHAPLDSGMASTKPAATVSTTSSAIRGLVRANRSAGATRSNTLVTTDTPGLR